LSQFSEDDIAAVLVDAWGTACANPSADEATDLFEQGGDSLTALQIIEIAAERLSLSRDAQEFLLPEIFANPTPRTCAAALVAHLADPRHRAGNVDH
jgi:hypothetical protein